MAVNQSALLEMVDALKSADGGELMRRMLAMMLQELINAEATSVIGAGMHEWSADRTKQRNGAREKLLTTGVGDLTVRIPKTHRVVLPSAAGPAPADRRQAARGDHAGPRRGRVDTPGG